MERHFTPEELARYDDDSSSEVGLAVEAHVRSCEPCRETLATIRSFDEALRAEETWHFTDELETSRHQQRLGDLSQRIAREDEEAERLLRDALTTPLHFLWSDIPVKRRYQTGGVVRVLARASATAREENLLHALNLADAAIAIAESLPADHYPAKGVYHLQGLAWKERANACRYLNRYDEAFNACDHAERAYRRLLVHDSEIAVMQYVRATILWKQQRLDEALPVARACAESFAGLRDHPRWIGAKVLEGSILGDLHASAAARDIFLALSRDLEAVQDPSMRAGIESNLANAYLNLGEIGSASEHFIVALQLFESLGITTEAMQVRWSIGVVALVSGNAAEAARRLTIVKQQCEAHQMPGDAALVALDLAEACLLLGRREDARRLAFEVFEHARGAGMVPAALTAAAFLRETAKAGRLTTDVVRHVRGFLRRLEAAPLLMFEPPPPENRDRD